MGCCGYGYFILGHSVAGHKCMEQMLVDNMPMDKNAGQNYKAIFATERTKCRS